MVHVITAMTRQKESGQIDLRSRNHSGSPATFFDRLVFPDTPQIECHSEKSDESLNYQCRA